MHVQNLIRGWDRRKVPKTAVKNHKPLFYKDKMKTKTLLVLYLLTKLLFLAAFFVRLEGRRLVLARRRSWRKHV